MTDGIELQPELTNHTFDDGIRACFRSHGGVVDIDFVADDSWIPEYDYTVGIWTGGTHTYIFQVHHRDLYELWKNLGEMLGQ